MPITPLHFGPGVALKSVLGGAFSFTVFALVNMLVDIEPVVRVLTGSDRLHAHLHTYTGATVIAILSVLLGKPICEWALRLWNQRLDARQKFLSVEPAISPLAAWSGALLGAWSHVALDSLMHADMDPLWPLATGNALLGLVSLDGLHILCIGSGIAGIVLLVVRRVIR